MSAQLAHLGIVQLGLFISAVLLLNLTPGPDTAYIVGQSLARGRLAGVLSALGISLGCCVHSLFCAFGLTALLAASVTAFNVIKFAGALYLVYLGVRMLIKRHAAPDDAPDAARPRPAGEKTVSVRAIITQGFLTNVFNPKVILFFVAFFPQFVAASSPHRILAFLFLSALFIAMSTVYNAGVGWLAGTITARLRRVPRVSGWLERGVGVAFIALGARLTFLRRPV